MCVLLFCFFLSFLLRAFLALLFVSVEGTLSLLIHFTNIKVSACVLSFQHTMRVYNMTFTLYIYIYLFLHIILCYEWSLLTSVTCKDARLIWFGPYGVWRVHVIAICSDMTEKFLYTIVISQTRGATLVYIHPDTLFLDLFQRVHLHVCFPKHPCTYSCILFIICSCM